ncbi:hypothetical protein [Paenibacillus elgii]|uniref:hypothetical protein n=1 Tax=Paenibacillus elgii TaxID=189691 RepID=UPI001E294483|nr:hypothetical protein [Paenibacillus elgii]
MNLHHNENLKSLLSHSLREHQDSYPIQQLLEQFPTTIELLDVTEKKLTTVKGIGMSKARQITAMLKLAKALIVPNDQPYTISSPKDVCSTACGGISLSDQRAFCLPVFEHQESPHR